MQDSDDYPDDIELDDSTLALLEAAESQYQSTQVQPTQPARPAPPGNSPRNTKRQKTAQGWAPTGSVQRAPSLDDIEEDLPEIVVSGNGSYSMFGARPAAKFNANAKPVPGRGQSVPPPARHVNAVAGPSRPAPPPVARRASVVQQKAPTPATGRPPPARHMSYPASSQTMQTFGRRSTSHTNVFNNNQPQRARTPVNTSRPHPPAQIQAPTDECLKSRLAILEAQMQELSRNAAAAEEGRREAEQARYAKEGEVTILRRKMDKTAQDHAADLAKLRAAKETADAQVLDIQRKHREEMERLKTQFTFKQHELETSARKPGWPGSARSKRTVREPPPTPIPLYMTQRAWQPTPSRSRLRSVSRSPQKDKGKERERPPPSSARLPGFVNAFEVRKKKDPETPRRGVRRDASANIFAQESQPPSPPSSPTGQRVTRTPSRLDSDGPEMEEGSSWTVDQMEVDEEQAAGGEDAEEEMFDWAVEFQRIVFAHSPPSSAILTVQQLMGARIPDGVPERVRGRYLGACTKFLAVLGAGVDDGWDEVAGVLVDIAVALHDAGVIGALGALLNLLGYLVSAIPGLVEALLGVPSAEVHGAPRLLETLCQAVRIHALPVKDPDKEDAEAKRLDEERSVFLGELFDFMDALAFFVPENMDDCLAYVVRAPQIVSVVVDERQPTWMLHRGARFLAGVASRPSLFRQLLAFPEEEDEDGRERDYGQLPHIERICGYLADHTRKGDEARWARESILRFLTGLSIADPDARAILLQSQSLVPSVIVFLHAQSALIWEDDEAVMESREFATETTRTVIQTLNLLYHLVFGAEPAFNLRQKLLQAAQLRAFNGLAHMFVVGLGRLSYADCPEWLEQEDRAALELAAETSRELLDAVVEGPELDSVWAAYQVEDEDEDEEEMMQTNDEEAEYPTGSIEW